MISSKARNIDFLFGYWIFVDKFFSFGNKKLYVWYLYEKFIKKRFDFFFIYLNLEHTVPVKKNYVKLIGIQKRKFDQYTGTCKRFQTLGW